MRIKLAIYILLTLFMTSGCIEEVQSESPYGKVFLSIGDIRTEINNENPQTRATVDGEWIKGDKVKTVVTFLDGEGAEISGQVHIITYEYGDEGWQTKTGGPSISLVSQVRSIKVDAEMEHNYENEIIDEGGNITQEGDKEGDIPVRGRETMSATKIIDNVIPTDIYTIQLVTEDWLRTSSLIEVINLNTAAEITIQKESETAMVSRNSTKAYFHVNPDAEYLAYVENEGVIKTYRINEKHLVSGNKYVLDLNTRPSDNESFSPDIDIVIPEYPGYLKYEDEYGNMTYVVINAQGLKNAFEEADIKHPDATIILQNSVDMTGIPWKPFGNSTQDGFKGTFDGNGKVIEGLTSTDFIPTENFPDKTESESYITSHYQCTGLFAYLAEGSLVKNVILKDISIEITAERPDVDVIIGSIVGINKGTVENCHLIGTPTISGGFKLSGSGIAGAAGDYDTRVGGIVGMNHEGGKVVGCSVLGKGTIESKNNHFIMAAGIVAYNFGDVVACYIDANHFNAPDYFVGDDNTGTNYKPEYPGYDKLLQGIKIIAISDHSDNPVTDAGGVVAYNDNKPLDKNDDSNVTGRVVGCYSNLDHQSILQSLQPNNATPTSRKGTITSQDGYGQTTYSFWSAYGGNETAYAIGNHTNASSSTTHTGAIHSHPNYPNVGKVNGSSSGKSWVWPTANSANGVAGTMNTGISNYGGCAWRYHNTYNIEFQPTLYKP